MPLLDIATPQSSFRNNLYSIGFQSLHHVFANQKTTRWRTYFHKPNRILIINNPPSTLDNSSAHLMIKAVATLEPRCSDKENGSTSSSSNAQQLSIDSITNHKQSALIRDDDEEITDEKEMLRRKRISKANKGKEAWNKGIQHSPETRQKIRERTTIAMRSPKVKMKLINAAHSQRKRNPRVVNQETRLKIGAAVRRKWTAGIRRRRMIARVHLQWLNLIAEASRKGVYGERELQWDSYKIIKEQCEKDYRDGVKARKVKPKPIPGRRIPKTPEQRKKISEAIAAKWADPEYRDRVHSGMSKRRGISSESRDPAWGTKKKEPKKIKPDSKREPRIRIRPSRANKVKPSISPPRYKDPQAGYKLEMIKSIRAQRAGSDPKILQAITRANILIAEAQRAAETLEVAAAKNPLAEASLIETRKLIAEAISYIKSIEMVSSPSSPDVKMEIEQIGVNGVGSVGLNKHEDENEHKHVVANGKERIDVSSSSSSSSWGLQVEEDVGRKTASEKEGKGRRRWVSGRLVEDDKEDEEEEEQ